MTLKYSTKLMKVADEFADFDLLKPKAQPGPNFHTQETESMFILNVQLKGCTGTNIKVGRSKDGSRITISGQMPVQDMLMVGGKVVKKDTEMRGFQKSFKVPQGVIFDQVDAMFREDESELVIRMPKVTKGLIGAHVEELKAEEIQAELTEVLHVYTKEELSKQETRDVGHDDDQNEFRANSKEGEGGKPKSRPRKFKICTPLIVGSAFFMSLVVLIFHLVESKKQENPRKKKEQD